MSMVVTGLLAAAAAALPLAAAFRLARPAPRAEMLHRRIDPMLFLYRGEALVDATPPARALLSRLGGSGLPALLDWLEVPTRHRTSRESALDAAEQADLHGLVLLDLPDHDSTHVSHRLEVDRLVGLVDVLVLVVHPQKYADDALHQR